LKTLPTEKRATDARIRLNGVPEGFWIRPKGSDLDVVLQIFSARDYDLSWCMPYKVYIKELCDQILHDGNVPLIIDAGANIGASTLWFAQNFPSSLSDLSKNRDFLEYYVPHSLGTIVELRSARYSF